MGVLRVSSVSEQVANYLKEGILEGRWKVTMPGRNRLATEVGVNRKTIDSALKHLEKEDLLISKGERCRRQIILPEGNIQKTSLNVKILLGEKTDTGLNYIVELQHRLIEAGHSASFSSKTLQALGMSTKRVTNMVNKTEADAWIIMAASRGIIQWFASEPIPAFSLFGRRHDLPIAGIGPDKMSAYRAAVRRLVSLGHKRIVLLVKEERRLPKPGSSERVFLSELEKLGIATSSYNLPDIGEGIDGLKQSLDSMFKLTPPTALIISEPPVFMAAQQHLARQGILAPKDVSLVCTDGDPYFSWQSPSVAHMRWDSSPWIRRVVNWANNISKGKDDVRQSLTKTEFVEGGTIGPARS